MAHVSSSRGSCGDQDMLKIPLECPTSSDRGEALFLRSQTWTVGVWSFSEATSTCVGRSGLHSSTEHRLILDIHRCTNEHLSNWSLPAHVMQRGNRFRPPHVLDDCLAARRARRQNLMHFLVPLGAREFRFCATRNVWKLVPAGVPVKCSGANSEGLYFGRCHGYRDGRSCEVPHEQLWLRRSSREVLDEVGIEVQCSDGIRVLLQFRHGASCCIRSLDDAIRIPERHGAIFQTACHQPQLHDSL